MSITCYVGILLGTYTTFYSGSFYFHFAKLGMCLCTVYCFPSLFFLFFFIFLYLFPWCKSLMFSCLFCTYFHTIHFSLLQWISDILFFYSISIIILWFYEMVHIFINYFGPIILILQVLFFLFFLFLTIYYCCFCNVCSINILCVLSLFLLLSVLTLQ